MKLNERLIAGGLIAGFGVALAGVLALGSIDRDPAPSDRKLSASQNISIKEAQAMIKDWPPEARLPAGALLEKYGAPDSASTGALIWVERGDWVRVAVYPDAYPELKNGYVEHGVRYEIPASRWSLADRIGLGVSYEPVGQILSASSTSEAADILALNVAVDVIEGRRSVADGRAFYGKTLDLAQSGKSSAYTAKLLFKPTPHLKARQPGQIWPLP